MSGSPVLATVQKSKPWFDRLSQIGFVEPVEAADSHNHYKWHGKLFVVEIKVLLQTVNSKQQLHTKQIFWIHTKQTATDIVIIAVSSLLYNKQTNSLAVTLGCMMVRSKMVWAVGHGKRFGFSYYDMTWWHYISRLQESSQCINQNQP